MKLKSLLMVILAATALQAQISIIPKPSQLTMREGTFTLTAATAIYYDPAVAELAGYAGRFAEALRQATGLPLPLGPLPADTTSGEAIWLMAHGARPEWGREGYALQATPAGCRIRANATAGFFYATQTLFQLLPVQFYAPEPAAGVTWQMPCVSVVDVPRFPWRGMHLDVCRHFFPVEFVKRYIDILAMHKINTFHWHLTDDQGWRIEIKKYPRLTEVGAWRSDGVNPRYGGYYTHEQIREVVAYAAERAITIVPEIEMPGHSSAALAAYPWLGCTGGPYRVQLSWGVFSDVFCAGKDTTFAFLEEVLKEVITLFPGEIIHVGGDECPKVNWHSHTLDQQRMAQEGLANEEQLQGYFMRRIESFLHENGRRMIGWDEIIDGGVDPSAAVMAWRGSENGAVAARLGHDVVMTPTSHCYFDYYQAQGGEPQAIGGLITLEKVYQLEPVPAGLSGADAAHIIGCQANLWTEYIGEPDKAEYMLLPRLCALSEVGWTARERREYGDFTARMALHYGRLETAGITVRFPARALFAGSGDSTSIDLWGADSSSGTRVGDGSRVGSDALLWSMNTSGAHSSLAIRFPQPVNMQLRFPWYSLTFSYRTNMAVDTLFIGFIDGAGRRAWYSMLQRHTAATNKWTTFSRPLAGFVAQSGFDSTAVEQFAFWTNNSRAGAAFQFADIYIGVPPQWPAAKSPIVFFDGYNYNPLFRIRGFANAPGSGIAEGAGLRPQTNALRWLPPADRSLSSIRWRFFERIDKSRVLANDTLKFTLKAPPGSDSLRLAFTDAAALESSFWLTSADGVFDGSWHTLALPLARFMADSGFAAGAVDLFSVHTHSSLPGAEILLTDLWIGAPPASAISSVDAGMTLWSGYRLEQNYPNPFNPVTAISYRLPERGRVLLTVHNILGQRVATLVDAVQEDGAYQLQWDAQQCATGPYYYRLQVNGFVQTRRMMLVR